MRWSSFRIIREKYFSCSKNPGISYSNPILVAAKEKQIPIVTEVELAYRISEAPFVGITGSNGKTTTTMLTFEMLKEGQKHPVIAGTLEL